ncbi:MAG: Pr6Pr family membrane protein [Chitinophagaceae bacterium]|nr:Pr6Pr family membrane protein [Chitinophagaceae bacterium]
MEQKRSRIVVLLRGIGSAVAWFAVIAQLYLIIINRVTSVPETIIRYFSFYTILTNILVALCLTISFLKPNSSWGKFFTRTATVTAIAVYIFVVGLVYNLILRFLWKPEGMQRLVDELLHSIIPVLYIVYWYIFTPKTRLKWINALTWLLYPLVYIIFILLRGEASGFYPYPFIDVNKLGYSTVFLNCFFLFLTFLFFSLLSIFIGRFISKSSQPLS